MKPIPAILPDNTDNNKVFSTREILQPFFSTEFHFHRECQLVYIVESSGQRIVGDSVEHFEHGELAFVGSHVPHVWHNDKKYFQGSVGLHAHSLAMYIDPDQLLDVAGRFGNRHEVEEWLTKGKRGIVFTGPAKDKLVLMMLNVFKQEGLSKISAFLNLLENLIATEQCRYLSSQNYINSYSEGDQNRMDRIFKYIFANFRRDIPLKEIASEASMNQFSFCRYFKSRTQKPFTVFVNELRIGHACRLIQERPGNIERLASESGFNNVTHFNRLFKRIKGITPKEYRNRLTNYS